ncbi:hypothetical protein, partial [Phocaeicola barnesiae]|uniref:hypothetical protein n=1 Tax=Phocaeicola barnesiae TaxID=376804 RepID=UPI0026700245
TKNKVFQFDYAEPYPILFKNSERREQRQTKNKVFQFDYAEPYPILFKNSERKKQRCVFVDAFC